MACTFISVYFYLQHYSTRMRVITQHCMDVYLYVSIHICIRRYVHVSMLLSIDLHIFIYT